MAFSAQTISSGSRHWPAQLSRAACCNGQTRPVRAPATRCSAGPADRSRRSALAAAVATAAVAWSQPALASQLRDFLQSKQKVYVMAPIYVTERRLQVGAALGTVLCAVRYCTTVCLICEG